MITHDFNKNIDETIMKLDLSNARLVLDDKIRNWAVTGGCS